MADRVEDYLDRLFDRLAGTGAAGRRVLIEAEAHLEEAVEHAMAQGLSREEAEAQAIRRFGSALEVARAHGEINLAPIMTTLQRIFATAWLMAGIGGVAVGLVGLFNAAFVKWVDPNFITEDEPGALYSLAQCKALGVADGDQVLCRAASIAHHAEALIAWPLLAGLAGVILLVLFAMARKHGALSAFTKLPNSAIVSSGGALAFGGGGLLFLLYGLAGLAAGRHDEVGLHLAEGLAALCASTVFFPQAWRAARLTRG